MGKISEVFYTQVDTDTDKASEYYFYYNLIGVDQVFAEGFEKHELEQLEIRDKALVERKDRRSLDMASIIYGVSSINNKAIIISNFKEDSCNVCTGCN